MRCLVCLSLILATPLQAATHGFCWRGDNGYRIEGWITYPDTAAGWLLTENTISDFGIVGYRGETLLGRWEMSQVTSETSWTLRFDTRTLAFPMGGYREDGTYQAWNAGGAADDCGTPGFGFNGGNRAQDVCVNGKFIDESGIAPDTPLPVSGDADNPCGLPMMSGLPRLRGRG